MFEDYYLHRGTFTINGITLSEILERYSTPFYLYSADVIREKYRRLKSNFQSFNIFYSLKANPNPAICNILLAMGANADVSSLGELKTALDVGIKPKNILFVGPGKTREEITFAVKTGIYAIIAESPSELRLIENIAQRLEKSVDVLLRINTLKGPSSLEVMVGGPSKFGFDEECVVEDVGHLDLKNTRISGVHVYSASQVLDENFICEHIENVLTLTFRLSREMGFKIKCIDFGGGFGVPYNQAEKELNLQGISKKTKELIDKSKHQLSDCRLVFEIGRYLVAESGIFVTKIVRIKKSRGKSFIITDGGINHFTRPAFLKLNHPVRILNKIKESLSGVFSVCGPCCTPFDVIGYDVRLPLPEEGDIIGVFNAGAYGYTMSMLKFLSFGPPKELLIDSGKIHLINNDDGL